MYKNLLNNKLMLGIFLLVLILQIIITQAGGAVFETVPLSVGLWCKILGVSCSVIVLDEIWKLFEKINIVRKSYVRSTAVSPVVLCRKTEVDFMHIRSISFHLFINYLCRCPKVHGPQDTGLLRALHSRNP